MNMTNENTIRYQANTQTHTQSQVKPAKSNPDQFEVNAGNEMTVKVNLYMH